ncbi:MAG: FKBP-type peptidyl-prolyl cis-trans isomerase [Betaproteobacteria bacterium]|nr:FKBP-type peptidyl-prolyl cis-trans isomerase [Betaproteobacteria bacterium]
MSFIQMANGLEYHDEVVGKGAETGTKAASVEVHYTGWLQNPDGSAGQKIDCSRERNEPLVFPLGKGYVIRGWDEGLQGMREGGKRTLRIPSNMAYGPQGAGDVIPPHADLIFDIELLKLTV